LTKGQAAQILLALHARSTTTTTTTTSAQPLGPDTAGLIEAATPQSNGTVHLQGWVFQRGADEAAQGGHLPHIVVNGDVVPTATSVGGAGAHPDLAGMTDRPDVAAAYGLLNPPLNISGPDPRERVGFDDFVETSALTNTICVQAWVGGAYGDVSCATATVTQPSTRGIPIVHVDSLSGGVGVVHLSGFGLVSRDPDPLGMIVHLNVESGGQSDVHQFVAGDSRADVAAAYPTGGAGHGFDLTWNESPGTYSVCPALDDSNLAITHLVGWNSGVYAQCQDVTVS
jgi:hypothetical protein